MSYRVVAAVVLAKDRQGLIRYQYEGAIVPWLSPEQAKHFLAEGLVEEIAAPAPVEGGDEGEAEQSPPPPPAAVAKPPKTAPKPAWVDYAVSKGWTADDADAASKQDLIDALG